MSGEATPQRGREVEVMADAPVPDASPSAALGLPAHAFTKADPADDAEFYTQPRLVTHIDDEAIAALTAFYRQALPAGGAVMDLMSSWVSHLPPDVGYAEVIGHGMNAAELAANPRLTRTFVQDLNREPALPLKDASLDAVTICVSIQYLEQPVEVLAEIARVLRPGGAAHIAYSNRCFPTKAVTIWRMLDGDSHARLISLYLDRAGFTQIDAHRLRDGRDSDPMTVVTGRRRTE
jgi:SAM-dependent methyltransferase